jgi:hypothetical protein
MCLWPLPTMPILPGSPLCRVSARGSLADARQFVDETLAKRRA